MSLDHLSENQSSEIRLDGRWDAQHFIATHLHEDRGGLQSTPYSKWLDTPTDAYKLPDLPLHIA